MPWFRVDDGFHSHPKTLSTSLSARGLWVTAGSWSSAHLTDGVVRVQDLAALGGTPELAAELVAAGLWKRRRNGWQFHDWNDKNPTRVEELAKRDKRAEAGRKGGLASGKARSKREANASANGSRLVEPPTRRVGRSKNDLPDPSRVSGRANPPGSPAAAEERLWCGECDERTRMLEDAEGRPYRCRVCHPAVDLIPRSSS